MTEARHDQAVALLTGTSPTITLLVERDQASAGGASPRTRPHSPPPPELSDSPEQEEGDEHLGNHLNCPMEDEYPIEVRAGTNGITLNLQGESVCFSPYLRKYLKLIKSS